MEGDQPKKKPAYQIGQDISLMSAGELQSVIRLLREEISRLEADISSKSASRNAAEAFFKQYSVSKRPRLQEFAVSLTCR